jgi:hypothetical protein
MRARVVHVAGQGASPSQPLLLSIFCFCLLPPSILIATTFYFLRWLKSVAFPRSNLTTRTTGKKRILITGDNTSSILGMSRALRSAGHNVYVVDYERVPFINPLRSSNAITKFVGLSIGGVAPNITTMKTRLFHLGSLIHVSLDVSQKRPSANLPGTILQLIESEKIELWIPCDVKGLQPVLQAKDVVLKHSACQIYGPDPEAARISQDQRRFNRHVERIGLDILFPSAMIVKSRAEIHHHLSGAPKGQKYLLERKASPLKTPFLPVTEKVELDSDMNIHRKSKEPVVSHFGQEYGLLPLTSSNETYSSVAALTISQEQPWTMHAIIEGKDTSVSALVVNNSICAFMARTSSQFRTFSSAKKCKTSSGQVYMQNGTTNWQQHEAAQTLDSNSAIAQTLFDFTQKFAYQLPQHINAQLNLHFIVAESSTSNGAVQKFWATGCDFGISPLLIQQALNFGQLESIGAAYSCASTGEPILLPVRPTTGDNFNSFATYSLPLAAYLNIWSPIWDVLSFRAPLGAVTAGFARFVGQVAFGQEELFNGKDPLPWIWTWFVQFPIEGSLEFGEHFINSLMQYSKRSASSRP